MNLSNCSPVGNFLSSKRRKLDNGEETTCFATLNSLRRKAPIMMMPQEILQNIFKYLKFQELSMVVRTVNRKFKWAAEDLLNKYFKLLPKKIRKLISKLLDAIEKTTDDFEVKCFCRLLNFLEMLDFEQNVIMVTIWRYVYNEFYCTPKTCMYGGYLLDLYQSFFYKFFNEPNLLYQQSVAKNHGLPFEVNRIINSTKVFCLYFDHRIEEPMQHALSMSGSKLIDFLDIASFATKSVIIEKTYLYYFSNSWLVAFKIPPERQISLQLRQRLMYMRIRRIVLAHTEMFMHQDHFRRELRLRNASIRKVYPKSYAGFGEVNDTFFCYGVMNDAAYFRKFIDLEEEQEQGNAQEFQNLLNWTVEGENVVPPLGLCVYVQLDCPVAVAPYAYLQKNPKLVGTTDNINGMFDLCVEFDFPGAFYSNLEPKHIYRKKFSTRLYECFC